MGKRDLIASVISAHALQANSQSSNFLYAIVDLATSPDRAAAAVRRFEATEARCILGDLRLAAREASPWLLRLTLSEQRFVNLDWTVEFAHERSAVTWLLSEATLDDLAHRLRSRTEAVLPGAHGVLLRYFDPRVLPVLHDVLDERALADFFSVGHAWQYLDRAGSLQTIAMTQTMTQRGDADPFVAPMRIDDAQFAALLAASEIDSVMPELAREMPDAFLALAPIERVRLAEQWLRRADAWRVEAFPERVLLCLLGLRLGETVVRDPRWVEAFANIAEGRSTVLEAIGHADSRVST